MDQELTDLIKRVATVGDMNDLCTPMKLISGRPPMKPGETTSDVEVRPAPTAKEAREFPFDLGGVDTAIFTVAPLYTCAGLGADIISLYLQSDAGTGSASFALYALPFPVVDAGPHSNLVYFADVSEWQSFLDFMRTVGFRDDKTGKTWRVSGRPILMADRRSGSQFYLCVFSPMTEDTIYEPELANGLVRMRKCFVKA